MKILLAGASGLLGACFASLASARGNEVIGVTNAFTGQVDGLSRQLRADLVDPAITERIVKSEAPDAIVNCAAISSVAACDADPSATRALNVEFPATLASQARRSGIRLIHLSSEQVFDGEQQLPYSAASCPHPINEYARQKLESEERVISLAPDAAIIRPPLLLGNSLGGRRGLHEQLLEQWGRGESPALFSDEFRQPCAVSNLAAVLLELCGRPKVTGVFHWAGLDLVSRHELGCRIREHFGLPERVARVAEISRASRRELAAKRPRRLALDLSSLASLLEVRAQRLDEQLATLAIPPQCRDWYLQSRCCADVRECREEPQAEGRRPL